jgi:hypothetical protein
MFKFYKENLSMSTKGNKKICIAKKNIYCSQVISQNSTNKPVLIFIHDALGCSASWKDFPFQLCSKMEIAGFCMIDWVMENKIRWISNGQKAILKRKPIF